MKVIELKSTNVKRIKAAELTIDPKRGLVLVSGRNGQGKSSLIDSIFYALGGKKAAPGKPIREGEERAEIQVQLAGTGSRGQDLSFTVLRTFTEADSYLTVTNNDDGKKFSNPQEFLDVIVGNLSFDPLAFSRMEPRKQIVTLTEAVGIDFTDKDATLKAKKEDRLLLGREMKALPAITDDQVDLARKVMEENANLPSVAEAMEKLKAAEKEVSAYEEAQRRIESLKKQIVAMQNEIATLESPRPEEAYNAKNTLQKTLETLQGRTDAYKDAERLLSDAETVRTKKKAHDALTEEIKGIEAAKSAELAAAKMPVEGLSWNEDTVLLQGIPFDQLSAAEQLKVSMAIAMATNPKLKIILVRDGSLLDPDNLAVIAEMAQDKDMQVWIERVDDTGKVGIYIEEGEVKAINE